MPLPPYQRDTPMITCHLRYVVYPLRLSEFEQYAKRWIYLVNRFGGSHHGYLLPRDHTENIALATFSFPSMEAYDAYRVQVFNDPDCLAATKYGADTGCFLSYERSFFRPVFA